MKRRAERKRLKNRSSIERDQYKLSMEHNSARIKEVSTEYYKDNPSANSYDLRETFNVVDRLVGQDQVKVLPWHTSAVSLAEKLVVFIDYNFKFIRREV